MFLAKGTMFVFVEFHKDLTTNFRKHLSFWVEKVSEICMPRLFDIFKFLENYLA